MKISICIPMYNEASSCIKCSKMLSDLQQRFMNELNAECEIIFCDDGSKDNTKSILENYILENSVAFQTVVGYAKNRGKGGAVKEAVLNSTGDIVIYTDTDLAYGTDSLFEISKLISDESDMVIGSRRLHPEGYGEYTLIRKITSALYLKILNIAAGFKYSDSQCGIKAIKGDLARKIFSNVETEGFSFDLEVIMIAQKYMAKITEMPVRILNHSDNSSKINIFKDSFKMLSDIQKIKKRVKNL